jgi:outer membrane protein OmpA-like peptidoglycan-associated protein
MNKKLIFASSLLLSGTVITSACSSGPNVTWKRTGLATAIGCTAGLGLGAVADEVNRKNAAKEKKNDPFAIMKKTKQQNNGKIVGLGVGCLAGLGTGLYLDMMYDDVQQNFKDKGIVLEKVPGADGKTEELLVKMDGDISFASGKEELTGTAQANVAKLGEALAAYPETDLKISGHTDSTGSRTKNLPLSQKRADSVKNMLVQNKIDAGRIAESKGFADDKKLVNSKSAEVKNRRVEVRVIPAK